MVKKGNKLKNGFEHHVPKCKKEYSDSAPVLLSTEDSDYAGQEKVARGKGIPNGNHSLSSRKSVMDNAPSGNKTAKKSKHTRKKEKENACETEQKIPYKDITEMGRSAIPENYSSSIGEEIVSPNEVHNSFNENNFAGDRHRRNHRLEDIRLYKTVVLKFIRSVALSLSRTSVAWVERHKPRFLCLKEYALQAYDLTKEKIQHACPIIFRFIKHFGKIMLLLFMVWLECTIRGFDSFLRMGTTSFFSIVWCSAFSMIAMAGIGKFLVMLVVAAAVGLFLGFVIAVLFLGIFGMIMLWLYGSFWTTGLITFVGGLTFVRGHDRVALSVTSLYSVYCAWSYVGWLGLLLGLNFSFVSSDALLFFLRTIVNEQRMPSSSQEQAFGVKGQRTNAPIDASFYEADNKGFHTDRNPGVPSTSGFDSELSSEDEVIRLLNCRDHYSALGLVRFDNIDASVVKREYRKKAMLVHPDKNMGNVKSAEAFQKLQNAYEVLLDTVKRKEYDDELRREELLNYFRKFQNVSHETKGRGLFTSNFARTERDSKDLLEECRRIACKKCGLSHLWVYTKKTKSRARWCQECKDFHPAKDGDGWVEQSTQPFFFGILQKVDTPSAFVCADGKVYDASEWYICQGLRCTANSHRPSFQVNTNIVQKNNHAKASGSQRGGTHAPNMEETMTEEEFFEWLHNAVQSGTFENFAGTTSDSPSGFTPKNSPGSGSADKRKKKGKKQW